jgi:HEAT repeat protein
MRNLPAKLVDREAESRGPRIQAAWETLIAAKDAGRKALLAEAARLDAAKQKDDRFRLGAAAVVWRIGEFDAVADIVSLWADADFAVKYSYAFQPAFTASHDGDERALPLLVALLRDQSGTYYVADHVMDLHWPLTHAFLWGPMGRKAVPALEGVLAKAKDPKVVSSAITLLADAWEVGVLPTLHAIAHDAAHGARTQAIVALGGFGHPDDYELLCKGLADADPKVARAHVNALCRFGDLRAVTHLLPLTTHADAELRFHAIYTLSVLATVDGLEAFAEHLPELDAERRAWLGQGPQLLHAIEVDWDDYQKLDRVERGKLLAKAHAKVEQEFAPTAGDAKASHAEFETACATWIEKSSLLDEEHNTTAARRMLGAAVPADLPLLLDVRGRLFRRLSDECLEEIAMVHHTMRRLVRSQYRTEPGVCEQVKPVPAAQGAPK